MSAGNQLTVSFTKFTMFSTLIQVVGCFKIQEKYIFKNRFTFVIKTLFSLPVTEEPELLNPFALEVCKFSFVHLTV